MVNQVLLEQAKDKYGNKNEISDIHYKDTMNNFILRIYNQCDPSSYGKKFVKKILRDHNSMGDVQLYSVFDKTDRGDMVLCYPKLEYFTQEFWDPRAIYSKKLHPKTEVMKRWFEVKISYLGKNDTFTIRNIRKYQDFDYFFFCFVDCKRDFRPRFMLIKKEIITDNPTIFTLTPMNGTKKANKDNIDIGYGTQFKRDSWRDYYLTTNNLLNGTTYQDLTDFLIKEDVVLKDEFELNVPINEHLRNDR